MKKLLQDFKTFALQGNVMSLAVGLIIGVAFQSVVSSLVDNVISPLIGVFVGQNFDYLEVEILGATLRYGAFITSVINFFIMAFVVFMMVRAMNRALTRKKQSHEAAQEPAEPPRVCPHCMTVIHKNATRCNACTSTLN